MSDRKFEQWEKKILPSAYNQFYTAPSPDLSPGRHRQSFILDFDLSESSLQNDKQFYQEQFEEDLISQQQLFFSEKFFSKVPSVFQCDSIVGNFQFEDEQIEKEKNEFQNLFEQILQNQTPLLKKKENKFPNKSFCRYIMIYAFRAIPKAEFQDPIEKICQKHSVDFKYFKEYYKKQIFIITGYQLLKKELIIIENEELIVKQRKQAFQNYLIWYLDNLATKDILQSKKKDLKSYLKYKNQVMTFYVRFPEQWNGNEPQWMKLAEKKQNI